jgi:hypothetical protein
MNDGTSNPNGHQNRSNTGGERNPEPPPAPAAADCAEGRHRSRGNVVDGCT